MTGTPTHAKSNSSNAVPLWPRRISLARMFDCPPTSVVIPPRSDPNASGMRSRPGVRPVRRASCITMGSISATTAALLISAANTAALVMITSTSTPSPRLDTRNIWPPAKSATPVRVSAPLMMNTDQTRITPGFENAATDSSGVSTPASASTTSIDSATTSARGRPQTKQTSARPVSARTTA